MLASAQCPEVTSSLERLSCRPHVGAPSLNSTSRAKSGLVARRGATPPPPPPPARAADCVLELISAGHSWLCCFPGCWVLLVVGPLCAGSDGPPPRAARRGAFMQVRQALQQRFPGMEVVGSNYPVPAFRVSSGT